MYEKAHTKAFGQAVVKAVNAVSDGIDIGDLDEGMNLMTALAAVSDEVQTDKLAALAGIAASILDYVEDQRIAALNVEPE